MWEATSSSFENNFDDLTKPKFSRMHHTFSCLIFSFPLIHSIKAQFCEIDSYRKLARSS